jgi:Resolvase, N terminal domain
LLAGRARVLEERASRPSHSAPLSSFRPCGLEALTPGTTNAARATRLPVTSHLATVQVDRPAEDFRNGRQSWDTTDEQRDSGLGLEAQQHALEQTAHRLSLPLTQTFTDAALSGSLSIDERPGLADAPNSLRRGDVLIVAKPYRIARDSFLSVLIEREATKKGARSVSAAGQGAETDDPAAIFTCCILDAFAVQRGNRIHQR